MVEEKIIDLLELKFAEPELTDCYLVDVKLEKGNRLEVYVDSDSGMDLEKCRLLSRYLESHLDENQWLGEAYVLEVSSPGVSRPLKLPRQYHKNIGRTLVVTYTAGQRTGLLVNADESAITLEELVKRKEGKKTIKETVQTVIPYDHIQKAIVQLLF